MLVYTNSRADLELKYVYAKLGTSGAYKLCPVDPPPADIDVTNPSNASIGFHSYEKVDNLISTYVNLLSAHPLIGFNIQPFNLNPHCRYEPPDSHTKLLS